MGWSIVPACWPVEGRCGCGRGHTGNDIGKAPLVAWKAYQAAPPAETEVTEWWTRWPLANIAGITGTVSDIAVVDVEYEGVAEAARMGVWSPLKALTGKGYHLFFQHPGQHVGNKVAFKSVRGLDVRGDAGYVMLAPSWHVSGRRYKWVTPPVVGARLPEFPSAMFADAARTIEGTKVGKPAGWIAEALGGLQNGNRDTTFASLVGRLHRDRWAPADIRAFLLPHALRVEYSEAELDKTVRSVTRYPVPLSGGRFGAAGAVGVATVEPLVVRRFDADWADYERRSAGGGVIEFATGYPRLDAALGGLRRGEILALVSRTETGKTNWLIGAAKHQCGGGRRVLYLATETVYAEIWKRYLALGTLVANDRTGFLVIDDLKPDIGRIAKAIEAEKPDLFIFDHINLVGDDNETLSMFMKGLKSLAREYNIPGIVAAQLNRAADWVDPRTQQKVFPRISMIKGSGTIEEVSAQILMLHTQANVSEAEGGPYKQILGLLEKNRYGEHAQIMFRLEKRPHYFMREDAQ